MTGAMKSTPIAGMEEITGIQSLEKHRQVKILTQAEKFKCQQGHLMKTKITGYTSKRSKRELCQQGRETSTGLHWRLTNPDNTTRPKQL